MAWYEWVFSGVGVPVGFAILGWAWHKGRKRKLQSRLPSPMAGKFPPFGVETTPSPIDISEALAKLSPYDSLSAPQKYNGLPVQWRLRLASLTKIAREWAICFELPGVTVQVTISDLPPQLKIAERGCVVWVRGAIAYIEHGSVIVLRDAEILHIGDKREGPTASRKTET